MKFEVEMAVPVMASGSLQGGKRAPAKYYLSMTSSWKLDSLEQAVGMTRCSLCCRYLLILCSAFLCALGAAEPMGPLWHCHTIDDSGKGADGVKLADANNDGLLDIATGMEEGGEVRIYIHPGLDAVRKPWPATTVGKAPDVEDATWIDLNDDGRLDVVASLEGKARIMRAFIAPETENAPWKPMDFPATRKVQWMFGQAADIDGAHGDDLIIGGKNKGASIGWLQAAVDNPLDPQAWHYHPLVDAAWIMSIFAIDHDGDGDLDIVYTDRRKPHRGVWLLEHPGNPHDVWPLHRLWTCDGDIMSMNFGDLDGDGLQDITVAVHDFRVVWLKKGTGPTSYRAIDISADFSAGQARSANPGDLDGDGDLDIAVTTSRSDGKHGVFWLENDGTPLDGGWRARAISGAERGIKFDHSELLDIDHDGDLDLLTCEEYEGGVGSGLGVIWYENPLRSLTESGRGK